jgi:ubiquinone/menaquinone biosynthesis C-methylase UbiE
MPPKKDFEKYKTRGAGYHWDQNSWHPLKMNAFVKARYQKCIKLLEGKLGSLGDKKILDMGCGDGALTYKLHRRGAESYGVDLSEEAIRFAQKKHLELKSGAQFFVESCLQTHFEDEYFDGVVSSDVIEHLDEPGMLLNEISRVLQPQGIAVISTPVRFTEHPFDKMHTVEWFPDEFKHLVRQVFPHASFEYSHPIFWVELFRRGGRYRLGVNLLAYLSNPFLSAGKWKFLCMQYAVIEKTVYDVHPTVKDRSFDE